MAQAQSGKDGRGNPENRVPEFLGLAQALSGIDLSQDKEGLRKQAEDNGAEEKILDMIDNLPEQEYRTMADVMAAVKR